MDNYFSEYKDERYHDNNLIHLVSILSDEGHQEILANYLFDYKKIGRLKRARRKRDFDVFLEFENLNCIIETKVDSDENGRFRDDWQTARIYRDYSNEWVGKKKVYLFITYGSSEYYIKECDNGVYQNGPYCTKFKHIGLNQIKHLLIESLKHVSDNRLLTWLKYLEFEESKRRDYKKYLSDIRSFRSRYKERMRLTDIPNNRINLSTPEFTFQLFFELANNINNQSSILGKVTTYPIGRQGRVNDSILNFIELWNIKSITCKGIIKGKETNLFFEINEDYNLHLKAFGNDSDINAIKEFIGKHEEDLIIDDVLSITEDYKQGAYVLYEWDIELLRHIDDTKLIIPKLESIITKALKVLE